MWFTESKRIAVIGLLVIAAVVLISYYPSVKVGFLGDDWWFLGKAASLSLPDYLRFYFDPTTQIFWYRPLYGILLLIEYPIFGSNPEGYHVVQILLHLTNSLLLSAVIWQISRRWRLALMASVFYAVLPVYSEAVFWIAVQDPLAMVFYLATVWFWVIYLQERDCRYYLFALGAFVLALLGKETSVFLLVTLLLIDRWLVGGDAGIADLFRRYLFLGMATFVYLVIEHQVQTNAYFPNRWGYGVGFHMLQNAARYLALLAFPWGLEPLASYAWLVLVAGMLVAVSLKWRVWVPLFLAIYALMGIAPAVPFPTIFFYARYTYGAGIVSAVLLALLFELVWTRSRKWTRALVPVGLLGVLLVSSSMTFAAAEQSAEDGRVARVPLRDIYQQHPTFPPDTYLYFVEPPYPMIMRNLFGMFFLRYGTNVTVWSNDAEWGGVDENRFARLHDHQNAFVYYFDESRRRHEVAVDASARSGSSPALPIDFQAPLRLEGYEVTSTTLKRGNELVLLLYWKAQGWIGKDYTVFVHLVNEKGETVLGKDSQPRGGRAPTRAWKEGKLVVDAHLLHISPDVPPGTYRLEVGLYYLPTMERLLVVDDAGRPVTDRIVIEPIRIME